MTDCEFIIYGILNSNWSTAVVKPRLLYDDSVKQRNIDHPHSIKIYEVSDPQKQIALGRGQKNLNPRITIDLQGTDRTIVLSQRDEILRCLEASKKNPSADFAELYHDGYIKQAGYFGYYHYTIDCFLRQLAKSI